MNGRLLAMIAICNACIAPGALAQTSREPNIRGAIFGAAGGASLGMAADRTKETTRRQAALQGAGPEAALLAGAGLLSPAALNDACNAHVAAPTIDCRSVKKLHGAALGK